MLFLLNDRMLVVPSSAPDLECVGLSLPQIPYITVPAAIAATQRAFLRNPNLMANEPKTSEAIAWVLAMRSAINAALFVPQPFARLLCDVPFRVATVSAMTLAKLRTLETQGALTSSMINRSVWLAAA